MNTIEFFGIVIKPKMSKGKFMFAPLENRQINENIYALRDKDVNAFIYKKGNRIIAIDCGYKNSGKISAAMTELNLNESEVTDLFITHLDLDHAGGIDKRCSRVFSNAQIHIGEIESKYLKKGTYRKKLAFIGLKTPIQLNGGYNLLTDNQTVDIGGIKVQAILLPGHTIGHLCYLVDDKYLFTGDSIVLVKGEGYSFYKLWNVDNKLNIESLKKLKQLTGLELVITSHSGFTDNIEKAFAHLDESPSYKEKGYKVSETAPYNPYE